MHLFRKVARAAPSSFWSSAPNLQVAILSFWLTANDGALGSIAINMAAMNAYRYMAFPAMVRFPILAFFGQATARKLAL